MQKIYLGSRFSWGNRVNTDEMSIIQKYSPLDEIELRFDQEMSFHLLSNSFQQESESLSEDAHGEEHFMPR